MIGSIEVAVELASSIPHLQTPSLIGALLTSPSPGSPIAPPGALDLSAVCIAIAAMSAQVGSIIVVFIAFAFQELRRIHAQAAVPPASYRSARDVTRFSMLLSTASVSMACLMFTSVLVVFDLLTSLFSERTLALVGLCLFDYSIWCLLFALAGYLILERPFLQTT